jgi:Zn-dependent protease
VTLSILLGHALRFAIIFPAIILHEISHGYVAYLLGDHTAKRAGRLSLNPIKHVDPVGTIILPIAMLVLSGGTFFFGWAKPVPINPWAFKNQREGMLLTGVAGPVTNIALAIVAGLTARFLVGPSGFSAMAATGTFAYLLLYFSYANLVLAFFNLLPIPPLDGSRVVQYFLPDRLRDAYHSAERYGFVILIGLSYVAQQVGVDIFGAYLGVTVEPLFRLITGA